MRHLAALLALVACFGFIQATRAADQRAPAKIDPVPEGWKLDDFGFATRGNLPELEAHCQLTSQPKPANTKTSLEVWAKLMKKAADHDQQVKDLKESDLKPGKFGGHDAFEYEYSGEFLGSTKLHYRVFYIDVGDNHVTLECWTTPEHWDAAQSKFEALANNVK